MWPWASHLTFVKCSFPICKAVWHSVLHCASLCQCRWNGQCKMMNTSYSAGHIVHFLLAHFSHVWLCDPVDCSLSGSSVHGDPPGKNTGVDCHALLQGIFLTRDRTLVRFISCIINLSVFNSLALAGGFFTTSTTWEGHKNIAVDRQYPSSHATNILSARSYTINKWIREPEAYQTGRVMWEGMTGGYFKSSSQRRSP